MHFISDLSRLMTILHLPSWGGVIKLYICNHSHEMTKLSVALRHKIHIHISQTISHAASVTQPMSIQDSTHKTWCYRPVERCDWQMPLSLSMRVCGDYNTAMYASHFTSTVIQRTLTAYNQVHGKLSNKPSQSQFADETMRTLWWQTQTFVVVYVVCINQVLLM